MKSIKYKLLKMVFLSALLFGAYGCDLIDPTEVENPAITQDKLFEDATGGAEPLVTGLKYAFADAVGRTTIFTEVVSDNYVNTSTFLSTEIDNPRAITPDNQDLGDSRNIYFKLQTLHALADFGLGTVLPADAQAKDADWAETYFYKGIAILMLSENFQAFPLVEEGPAVRSEDAILMAIEQFKNSLAKNSSVENTSRVKLALARSYRVAGDKGAAVQAATEAIAASQDYLFTANYDPVNLLNRFTVFALIRTQNDIQPLPRLDFLDPKYNLVDGSNPIAVLKTEEAYLILAEAALKDGDLQTAKTNMVNALNTAKGRATVLFTDIDPRLDRPSDPEYKVKAGSDAAEISGLILARGGKEVTLAPTSGTSLTEDMINALSSPEELYRSLYLLRQEIFFAEGRRMSDLGIRLPVMARQIDTNPNFSHGSYGTVVHVPSYIPEGKGLDAFSVNDANKIVTIANDMNKVIADNISEVSPF